MEDFRDDRGKPDPTKKFPISKEIPVVRKTKRVEKSQTTGAGEIKTEKVRTY